MKIIDFDGTLVDVWERYYNVFSKLSGIDIDISSYIKFKREIRKDIDIAKLFDVTLPSDYFEKKAELLEDKRLLAMDKLILSKSNICKLFENDNIILLSKRRNKANLSWELKYLGIETITSKTEVVNYSKLKWVENNVRDEKSIIVGDSIQDLEAGKLSHVLPIMVETGLGDKKQYDETHIEYILYKDIGDAMQFIVNW